MGLYKWAAAGLLALGFGTQEGCILAPILRPLISSAYVNSHFNGLREKYEPGQATQSALETAVEAKHGLRILGSHTEEDVKAVDEILSRLERHVVEPVEDIYIVRESKLMASLFGASAEAHPENMSICLRKQWTDNILVHEVAHVYHFQLLKNANPASAASLSGLVCSDNGCDILAEHADDGKMPQVDVTKPQCPFEQEWFAVKKKHGKDNARKDMQNPGQWRDGYPGPRNLCARPYGATNKMEDVATHVEELYTLCYNKAFVKGKKLLLLARLYPTEEKAGYQELADLLRKHGFISEEDRAYAEQNIASDYEKYKHWMNKYEFLYPLENPWSNKLEDAKKEEARKEE